MESGRAKIHGRQLGVGDFDSGRVVVGVQGGADAQPGFGATPPAQAQPDVEVPDLRTLAEQIGVL